MNHDNTTGTVDLISKYSMSTINTYWQSDDTLATGGGKGTGQVGAYCNSDLREWLNTTLYDGFASDIQNIMSYIYDLSLSEQQTVKSGNLTYCIDKNNISDKVKAPSLTELGISMAYAYSEGSIYPLFGNTINSMYNSLARCKDDTYNTYGWYWTRGRHGNNMNYAWYIDADGWAKEGYVNSQYHYRAIIRFGKK